MNLSCYLVFKFILINTMQPQAIAAFSKPEKPRIINCSYWKNVITSCIHLASSFLTRRLQGSTFGPVFAIEFSNEYFKSSRYFQRFMQPALSCLDNQKCIFIQRSVCECRFIERLRLILAVCLKNALYTYGGRITLISSTYMVRQPFRITSLQMSTI